MRQCERVTSGANTVSEQDKQHNSCWNISMEEENPLSCVEVVTHEKNKISKTSKSRRETAVQGTNDCSIVSKCSMVAQGYFDDPFLKGFVSKITRRAPLIHRGYYIRAKTIDFILTNFLEKNKGPKQIISLGAGFDSAYFRLNSLGLLQDTVFFEVDFSEVVKRKCALILANPEMADMVQENEGGARENNPLIEMSRERYKLLGVDLSQINTLEAALKLCNVDFDTPTLLMSECVLTYMTRKGASGVVTWASETFTNSMFVLYEQINPDDAFGLFMQNHFHTVGSPLKSINLFPTRETQKERFVQLGWQDVEVLDMNQFYYSLLPSEERKRIEHLEPFDEYEEWHLKCAHYMVLCGYHGNVAHLLTGVAPTIDMTHHAVQTVDNQIVLEHPLVDTPLRRFGHALTQLSTNLALSIGGFGEQNNKHMRVTAMTFVDLLTHQTWVIDPNVDNKEIEVSRMHPTATCLQDGSVILIGGRLSPMRLCTQVVSIQINYGEPLLPSLEIKNSMEMNELNVGKDEKLDGAMNSNSESKENVNSANENMEMNCGENEKMNCVNRSNMNCAQNVKSEMNNSSDLDVNLNKSVSNNGLKNNTKTSDVAKSTKMNFTKINDNFFVSKFENGSILNNGMEKSGIVDVVFKVVMVTGDIPAPRWRHTTQIYQNDGLECLIVFGGRTQNVLSLGDCYKYTPSNAQWTKLSTEGNAPSARQSHTSDLYGNTMVIAGGLDNDLQSLTSVHLLDLDTLVWTQLKCDILPRYSHTSHVIGDYLVLIGGVSFSHTPPGVAVIHLPSGNSLEFSLPAVDKERLVMLHSHTSVAMDNNRILLLGGGGNCFSFGTHLNSSPLVLDISRAIQMMEQKMLNL